METILAFLGILFLIPFIVLYSTFSWGYVAVIFWSWFIIPLFPNLPLFTWFQFAGIMFMIGCFIRPSYKTVKKEYKDEVTEWVSTIISPWLTLLGGWIFYKFIY
jgi:hypothetical protein